MVEFEIVVPGGSYAVGFCRTNAAEWRQARSRLHRARHAAFVSFERIKDETCR